MDSLTDNVPFSDLVRNGDRELDLNGRSFAFDGCYEECTAVHFNNIPREWQTDAVAFELGRVARAEERIVDIGHF